VERQRIAPRVAGRGNGKDDCLHWRRICRKCHTTGIRLAAQTGLRQAVEVIELEIGQQLVPAGKQQMHGMECLDGSVIERAYFKTVSFQKAKPTWFAVQF